MSSPTPHQSSGCAGQGGNSVFSRVAGGKLQNKRDSPEQREMRKKQAAVKAATNFRGEVRQVPPPRAPSLQSAWSPPCPRRPPPVPLH